MLLSGVNTLCEHVSYLVPSFNRGIRFLWVGECRVEAGEVGKQENDSIGVVVVDDVVSVVRFVA